MTKAAKSNAAIVQLSKEFELHFNNDVLNNFSSIQQTAQKIKDEYYRLMQEAATEMALSIFSSRKMLKPSSRRLNSFLKA